MPGNPSSHVRKVSQGFQDIKFEITSQETPDGLVLTQRHRRHSLITELAIFLRGCVINAAMTTKRTHLYADNISVPKPFEILLSWKNTCTLCGGLLRVPKEDAGRRALSVGVKDIRIGNRIARSEVSTKRLDIYDCLSEFTVQWVHFGASGR